MGKKIRKVVFPVGGFGTRFLPATKAIPKEMLPVVDKPIIHYAFEEAKEAGIEQFIFITGRNKSTIDNHFDHSYELETFLEGNNKIEALGLTAGWLPDAGNIMFTRQQQMRGLGHAVWCARNMVGDEPFAVILADDLVLSEKPCLKQMIEAYEAGASGGNVLAVTDVPRDQTNRYGILDVGAEKPGGLVEAKALVEKPAPEKAPSTLSIIGRYILQPEIFDVLENQKPGAGGEIQLTDAINALTGKQDVYGYRYEGTRFDCGNHTGYVSANVAYALAREEFREPVMETLRAIMAGK